MSHQAAMTHEAVLELNYMYNATPWLHILPDVQGYSVPMVLGW
jgi:hypothetical protein